MGKKKDKKTTRAEPMNQSWFCTMDAYETLCGKGYTKLSHNPEIMAAVNKIADLVSGMTIHLVQNTEKGDVRVKNELSRKLDIMPNKFMTRKTFISVIVRTLLLEGDGNAVVIPTYSDGYLQDLVPVAPGSVSFMADGSWGYKLLINGSPTDPEDVLHFAINPDTDQAWKGTGYRIQLKEVAKTLQQASETKKGFMESKWHPSLIVKVDSTADELASQEGRKKLSKQYLETSSAGEPWMIPADLMDIKEVRPLSLNDIALPDSVKLDKRTVAAILDVPPFIVGEGSFDREEWNNFIATRIKGISDVLMQTFTRSLLLSPNWYFRHNIRSLYSYDLEKLSKVGDDNYTRGIMTGNEVRDWIGLDPMEGLENLVILENYIPAGMIADQKKLVQGGEDD